MRRRIKNANSALYRVMAIPNFLTPAECQKVIDETEGPYYDSKVTDKEGLTSVYRPDMRKSLIKLIPRDSQLKWLHQRLEAKTFTLNQQYYRFKLLFFATPALLRYDPEGCFHRHTDTGIGSISTRKLSLVIPLSSPEDFKGGELKFYPPGQACPQAQGSLIVFPAYMLHEVTPVTQGVRYSMVNWVHGPPFR